MNLIDAETDYKVLDEASNVIIELRKELDREDSNYHMKFRILVQLETKVFKKKMILLKKRW